MAKEASKPMYDRIVGTLTKSEMETIMTKAGTFKENATTADMKAIIAASRDKHKDAVLAFVKKAL